MQKIRLSTYLYEYALFEIQCFFVVVFFKNYVVYIRLQVVYKFCLEFYFLNLFKICVAILGTKCRYTLTCL